MNILGTMSGSNAKHIDSSVKKTVLQNGLTWTQPLHCHLYSYTSNWKYVFVTLVSVDAIVIIYKYKQIVSSFSYFWTSSFLMTVI